MKKAWLVLELGFATVALLLVSFFCAYAWPDKEFGLSGWVQAFGSIAAIIGAFYIGRHQADVQLAVAEKARKDVLADRNSTVKSIADRAYQRCWNIKPDLEGEGELGNLVFFISYRETDFSNAIKLLDAAPHFELGSGQLVEGILVLRDAMYSIQEWIQLYRKCKSGESEYVLRDEELRSLMRSDLERAERAYKMIIEVTGGTAIRSAEPFPFF
jgi:hypothetical protein